MASSRVLPNVPVKHAEFISYVQSQPRKLLSELLEPYKQYDATLREVFAQEPDHPALTDGHLNIVPVFNGLEKQLKIRARDPASQSQEENDRYVMPLFDADRRPDGSPAIVESLDEFKNNFAIFCEQSLVDLDWSNVVAAGSSVVTSLLPVPEKYKNSKKALRQYYHELLAPASDVDLFLYGLSEEDAINKIIEIEQRVKDSILTEVTTIRTKNAITIVSHYPTRHIQIVLRMYKSISEILTGFDVDCSCAAYDGQQVYAAPRALAAYMTQANTVDLTRRSPSYENRLSKYSRRGFEVYWPLLDRSRIDPTIFERNFGRTVGLARLLVLERLPSTKERDAYTDDRRRERGRPAINRHRQYRLRDNIKAAHEDEVAEWVEQEDVSDYHTFTIPYGPRYSAKKIEKLLYTQDILLNAEWNKKNKDREVDLHRHPAFFGYAEDIIHDCCGFCPKPKTPEEVKVAEEEAKVYVSGKVSLIKDDPGRQAIGSFNPITDNDWTEMAYVGNTARLCQAIVDQDLEHVQDWLSQDGSDPNCRDYTGRTPLHLAVMCSSPEIVRELIDHNARLVARLADGRTALHLAAARGDVEIVRLIMQRSERNEADEAEKEDARKRLRKASGEDTGGKNGLSSVNEMDDISMIGKEELSEDPEDHDVDMIGDDTHSRTTGSFVKVESGQQKGGGNVSGEDENEPDVYDVNVLAWDLQCSPLHLAILHGNVDVVKELVQNFGADVLLPIKLLNENDKSPRGAILTLVLPLNLPLDKAKLMTKTLLELGASSAQADTHQTTALHYISCYQPELLDVLFEMDHPAAKRAISQVSTLPSVYRSSAQSPLMSAITKKNTLAARKLLGKGANPVIEYKDWIEALGIYSPRRYDSTERNQKQFHEEIEQPIVLAIENELTEIASELLEMGSDPNTLTKGTWRNVNYQYAYDNSYALLDVVRSKIKNLRGSLKIEVPEKPKLSVKENVNYLEGFEENTYAYFVATKQLRDAERKDSDCMKRYELLLKDYEAKQKEVKQREEAIQDSIHKYEELEKLLLSKGAKTFQELYPKLYKKRKNYGRPTKWGLPAFAVDLNFSVHDLGEETKKAYPKLFQAVWDNDVETVKSLTLSSWGNGNKPLIVTVKDSIGCSTFFIAVMRGHYDLARVLVEISYAQYEPKEKDKPKNYRIADQEDDDDDGSDIGICETTVDDRFTIENIGEVSMETKTITSPLSFMDSHFPASHYMKLFSPHGDHVTYGTDGKKAEIESSLSLELLAITINDMALFSFLLDLKTKWANVINKDLGEPSQPASFLYGHFFLAVKWGRVEILEEMIRQGGAGMELASLVKNSGTQYREKTKSYQGLTVRGKKRSDWVDAARGKGVEHISNISPPLLKAALIGSLRSVEWFLSDIPYRRYLDFAEANKNQKFIAHLNKSGGGFEKVLQKWFYARRELALHCAVKMQWGEESTKIVKYLLEIMPESLNVKSANGQTPLALAFAHRRLDAAKLLINAGADQTTRDNEGCNILHHLLHTGSNEEDNPDHWQPFLDLIDKRLVSSLLTERCSRNPGSLTPLNKWLHFSGYKQTNQFRALLAYAAPTNNGHLELFDSTGDTPLHYLVRERKASYLKIALEHRPDLLFRENSVGRTPYEMAEDNYISSFVREPLDVGSLRQSDQRQFVSYRSFANHRSRTSHRARDWELGEQYLSQNGAPAEEVWRICKEKMDSLLADDEQQQQQQQHQQQPMSRHKRKLVSLNEANEVAKRLAAKKRYMKTDAGEDGDGGAKDDDGSDAGAAQESESVLGDEISHPSHWK
ncbi:ankyrin [Periconia macrospinosa]|uniref:Ankyrin n=1 Tax=Periconia macrospinosa TaxID=97972 RepID=A0A2V1EAT8_9PLEO|nr:ankyrin [Periconia macrospinosa]